MRAGTEIFSTRGFLESSVAEIAEAAGVTPRAVYYHFDSKEALLAASVAPFAQVLVEIVERTASVYDASRDHWRDAASRVIDEIFVWSDTHPHAARLYYVWSRLGLPTVSSIRNEVLDRCVAVGATITPKSAPRSRAGALAMALAVRVSVGTADDVMSSYFSHDAVLDGADRADVAEALAVNNGALNSTSRGFDARQLIAATKDERSPRGDVTSVHRSGVPRPAHRPSRRDELLRAAISVLAESGPAEATVRDISAAAGMGTRAIHYHYASKHDLIAEAVEQSTRSALAAAMPLSEPGSDLGRELRTAWKRYSAWISAWPNEAAVHRRSASGVSLEIERVRRATYADAVATTRRWMAGTGDGEPANLRAHIGAISMLELFLRGSELLDADDVSDDDEQVAIDVAVVDVGLRILDGAGCAGALGNRTGRTPPRP